MRLAIRFIVVLAMLVTVFVSEAPAANILVNPGFETGALAPWVNGTDFCGGCVWAVTDTDSHSGTFSAFVNGNRLLEQTFAAIDTALLTEASLWLRMPGGPTAIADIQVRYADDTFDDVLVDVPTTWTQFDVTSLLAAGKELVAFGVFGCSGCGGESLTFADDFVIDTGARAVPLPATLALLLLGVGVFGLSLRGRLA
jgi:hypothetical protein